MLQVHDNRCCWFQKFGGLLHWHTLKPSQRKILEHILEQPPKTPRRPFLCTLLCSPAVRTNSQPRLKLTTKTRPRSIYIPPSRRNASAVAYPTPYRSSFTSLLNGGPCFHANFWWSLLKHPTEVPLLKTAISRRIHHGLSSKWRAARHTHVRSTWRWRFAHRLDLPEWASH